METQVVIDDEQGTGLVAGGQHALGLVNRRRNGLFAVDGAGTGFYCRVGDLGVDGGVRGNRDNVEGRGCAEHLAPVGERGHPITRVVARAPPVVATATGD